MNPQDLFVLFGPLVLGMSSGLLVSKSKIPVVKSKYNPPAIVFSIVWPILYAILGYSSYLIHSIKTSNATWAIRIFYIHLAGLIVWWPLFVYFPNKTLSLTSLAILALSAIYIATLFYEINKTAGLILTPYILWLFVANFLTYNT